MSDPDSLRRDVSRSYTEALAKASRAPAPSGCCAPSCCSGPEEAAADRYGVAAEAHPEAAQTSFGCGNPLAFEGVQPGQTVLDLGSGAGLDLLVAAEKVGPSGRVLGVDMTDAMIEAARANATKAGLAGRIEVRKGIIEALPVADASVDWVISNCVINLSPEKPRVFAEIARVLRRGGRFSISDIVVEALPDWLRADSKAYAACVAGAIPESEYVRGLQRAGLMEVEVASRHVYGPEEILGLVEHDFGPAELDRERLRAALDAGEVRVASVRFRGRKPGGP